MVAENAFEDRTHERTLAAPTLPQAVEHSIVATSTTTHTLTQASKCERINSKPRTFSAYIATFVPAIN